MYDLFCYFCVVVIYPENGSGEADESGDLPIGVNSRMGGQAASIYLASKAVIVYYGSLQFVQNHKLI